MALLRKLNKEINNKVYARKGRFHLIFWCFFLPQIYEELHLKNAIFFLVIKKVFGRSEKTHIVVTN